MNDAVKTEAEVLLSCDSLDEMIDFFQDELGFRIEVIFPADDPRVAHMSGHGLQLHIERGASIPAAHFCILSDEARAPVSAPNGSIISFRSPEVLLDMPPLVPSLVVTKIADAEWGIGRAGMQYRDLIADRQGGRFIASHIRIPEGGPVPDYVHFHKVRFQMIYCVSGWTKLVYEDQGDPFIMKAGDCVLQPPEIRHRVLECSDAFEVIEIGCPAEHPTLVDHDLTLPTDNLVPDREFFGQKFQFHQAEHASWADWRLPGFIARDIGIADATDGLAGVKVVKRGKGEASQTSFQRHAAEFVFLFILSGQIQLETDQGSYCLGTGDSFTVPAGLAHRLTNASRDIEILEVMLAADSLFEAV